VTERKLRYSERKRLAETGTLGDYVHEDVPQTLRNALWYLIYEPKSQGRDNMVTDLQRSARLHFGWVGDETPASFVLKAPVSELLDFIEILIENCTTKHYISGWNPSSRSKYSSQVMPDVEARVNELCERHRFGYRLENGEARKIGSPALEAEVVGPTLLAVQRPGWDQVERSYREALDHQRGGETDDAITAAHAAVEAALKAVGMSGKFSAMTKQFRNSALVPPYLRQTPEALESLLTLLDRSNAVRSTEGDAHGKASGAEEVPQALAGLAIHWAGAFIVYLAETTA
jgi:hypothetical protein